MKVILIEDRKERQNRFIETFNFDFKQYQGILFNATDSKYIKINEALKNEDYKVLEDFDIIISHKSAFEEANVQIIHRLENYAKTNNKKLVFFSGGIDSVYYYKEDEFEYMELNSTNFYSNNLKTFLEKLKRNLNPSILVLAYGNKWKLNIFIDILDKIAKYIQDIKKDKTLFKIFYKKNNLEKLEDLGFEINFKNREITKKEMIEIKNKLANYIEEIIRYENYNS